MNSSAIAMDTMAMRPGLFSGPYPERGDSEPGLIDRSFTALQGALSGLSVNRTSDLDKIIMAIGRQGDTLTGQKRAVYEQHLILLRRQFRNQGLSQKLCIQAFALIRELSTRTLQLRHYDTQLMAGWVMLHGRLAEMETGEGKTLAATLAAATAALAGIPVHVITVNEYLVERDAKAMKPLYQALGLTVGYVTQSMAPEDRRGAYACDITYCTNKQVTFDYLRDRLLLGNNRSQLRMQLESVYADNNWHNEFLLRGLCFAIVDEADSVLIDEARTPLILTQEVDSTTEHALYRQALKLAQQLEDGVDYFLDSRKCHVQLSLAGQQKLELSKQSMGGSWQHIRQREELLQKALHALYVLQKDRDYLVHENKVMIIDANTGRTMPDRSWEGGLHQLVEAKEDCPLTPARVQLGRLTYQRFFRRYLRLGGMTGTAREVSVELRSVYGLPVQKIPLHRPSRRMAFPTQIYSSAEEKWTAVIGAVVQLRKQGRPVLIGTGSVADSELLSRKLAAAEIAHRVLNARQDGEEADIVAAAGMQGQVTVATNMAGRGTDIPLAEGISERGGLHVVSTCCNEAKRIDRQLYGRCARQGDPGSHQAILSLEDELAQQSCCPVLLNFLGRHAAKGGRMLRWLNLYIIRCAQQRIERRHREARRALLQYGQQTDRLLSFTGNME